MLNKIFSKNAVLWGGCPSPRMGVGGLRTSCTPLRTAKSWKREHREFLVKDGGGSPQRVPACGLGQQSCTILFILYRGFPPVSFAICKPAVKFY